jgi:sugar-specific transcriptional regulator TrmB
MLATVRRGSRMIECKKIRQTLKDFGLSQKEAEIYISLAKHGALTGGEISKLTKTHRPTVYRFLKILQKKGVVESTLESPTRYVPIPFETILESNIQTKREEVAKIEKAKNDLLNDWKSIRKIGVELHLNKFVVIEGRRRICRKIQKIIEKTKEQLSIILDASDLAQFDQINLFEKLEKNPNKPKIRFRIITRLAQQDFGLMKALLKRTPRLGVNLKVRNPDLGLSTFPRMLVRDDEEVLLFISSGTSFAEKDEVCLWTNCQTLVQTFSGVFVELWEISPDIKQKMLEIETGKPAPMIRLISDAKEASKEYDEKIGNAETELLVVTSSGGLLACWKQVTLLKQLVEKGVSVEIMAPISKENLKEALRLSEFCQVRHVPRDYMKTTIIDGKHLFQFRIPESYEQEQAIEGVQRTFYTNDFEYVEKTRNMLLDIWKNSTTPSEITAENFVTASYIEVSEKRKNIYFEKLRAYISDETDKNEITEQDVINKISSYKRSSRKGKMDKPVVACSSQGAAIIRSHENFNLPDTVIVAGKIDEKSDFGAEDALGVFLLLNTPKGYRYVPVAAIGDNPRASDNWKRGLLGSPAEKNYHLVKKEELQIQLHGNTFFVGWTIPIPLLPNQNPLPPSVLIFEATGKLRTRAFSCRSPTGALSKYQLNFFDAFVTFIHQKVKYQGPATDGLFARELYSEWYVV